jgi:hypothetical protein
MGQCHRDEDICSTSSEPDHKDTSDVSPQLESDSDSDDSLSIFDDPSIPAGPPSQSRSRATFYISVAVPHVQQTSAVTNTDDDWISKLVSRGIHVPPPANATRVFQAVNHHLVSKGILK